MNNNNLPNEEIKELYKKYFNIGQVGLLDKFEFSKEKIVKAKGSYIYTSNGEKILDITSGFGTQNLGYNHPEIIKERIEFATNDKMAFSRLFFNENIATLAEKMAQLLPGELDYSFFCNSGAEANEGALKLAYKYHGGSRTLLLHNENSFHGKLIATSQITSSPEVYFEFQSSLNTECLDLTNLDTLKKTLEENKDNIYAVILEPFSASLANPIEYEKLLSIYQICKKEDIVVIFDEVYSGFYRTSNLFYFMNEKRLQPDIVTYSKSFGGGIASISGYTVKKDIFKKAYGSQKDALLHSSTYSNYVEEDRIALKTLEILSNSDFLSDINTKRDYLVSQIHSIEKLNNVNSLTGDGFHWGIGFEKVNLLNADKLLSILPLEITKDPRFIEKLYVSAIINELYREFKILSYAGFNRDIKLFFSPPVVIEKNEIDYVINALKQTIDRPPLLLIINFVKNYLLRLFNKD
tara:strand:- start:6256 stop:7650 length:1395 start_codon:yes stop_codon:yes gene_type:complete